MHWYALVMLRSWVQIPYRSEIFSGLIFTTTQVLVVFITAKIAFIFISLVGNRLSVSQTCDPKMQMAFLLKSPEHPHRNHLKMIPSHQ